MKPKKKIARQIQKQRRRHEAWAVNENYGYSARQVEKNVDKEQEVLELTKKQKLTERNK